MGTFERIRQISPYFFGLFAVMLVLFFTIGDQTVVDGLTGSSNDPKSQIIGEVNDDPIYYVEFEQKVRERIDQQRAQMQDPSQQINEAQIRSDIWKEMVDRILLKQEAEKAGILITNEMLVDKLIENPPEYLKRSFQDSAGNFQKDLYLNLVTDPESIVNYMGDPSQITEEQKQQQIQKFRNDLIEIENILKEQLLQMNLQTTVKASAGVVSPTFAKRKYEQQNTTADFTFVALKSNHLESPEKIDVTDEEAKDYYVKYKQYYKQEPQRKIKYMSIPIIPSADDSARAIRRINKILADLNNTQDQMVRDSIFDVKLSEYSGINHDYTYIKDVPRHVIKYIGMAEENVVIGPFRTPEGTSFFRVDDRRSGENISVKASHILIKFGNDKDSAKAEAERIYQEAISGENFATLAMKYSQDQGSKMNGGSVGYFGKGQMVKPFEEACFAAEKGEITGPVESRFGFHIIYVEDKNSEEIRYSELSIKPRISSMTKNMIYRDAASIEKQIEDGTPMDTVVSRINKNENKRYQVKESRFFKKGSPVLKSQYLSDKAFELELGEVIKPDEYEGYGVIVAQVSEIREEGIKPFEDVVNDIKRKLTRQKQVDALEPLAMEAYNKVKSLDSLQKANDMLEYDVNSLNNQTFQPFISGIGKEPVVAYKIFNADLGKIHEPIKGDHGYYIIQVHRLNQPTEEQIEKNFTGKLSELRTRSSQSAFMQWFTKVKENATIIDNRNKYYREY